MNELINYLEQHTDLVDIEFVAEQDQEYLLSGLTEDEDEEVEINVTFTNYVYIDGEEQHLNLPFNVWSL